MTVLAFTVPGPTRDLDFRKAALWVGVPGRARNDVGKGACRRTCRKSPGPSSARKYPGEEARRVGGATPLCPLAAGGPARGSAR